MTKEFLVQIQQFSPKLDQPLAQYTTWQIGGPADCLVEINNSTQLLEIITIAKTHNIPYTILGGGSNVLISDKGLRGLVIINRSKEIQILSNQNFVNNPRIKVQHQTESKDHYTFDDIIYEEDTSKILVQFDSGVNLPYAIGWLHKNGITGLQWFAGIPGTIGGALFNNIHGGTRHFSDYFHSAVIFEENIASYKFPVKAMSSPPESPHHSLTNRGSENSPLEGWTAEPDGVDMTRSNSKSAAIRNVDFDFFQFGYDQSILRNRQDITILSIIMQLEKGDVTKAKEVYREWNSRKRVQPKNTCGCIFKNLTSADQTKLGFPTPGVGYIIDKVLGWKGKQIGGLMISNWHAAFMENTGRATATDALKLISSVKKETKKRLNVDLELEISLLGFSKEELASLG